MGYLDNLKDKDFKNHYSFTEDIKFLFKGQEDISKFIKLNKPIHLKLEGAILY